ncbi:hypothetical protein T484DRAFT_1819716, partial [Baffinella frigidus]
IWTVRSTNVTPHLRYLSREKKSLRSTNLTPHLRYLSERLPSLTRGQRASGTPDRPASEAMDDGPSAGGPPSMEQGAP